MTKRNSWLSAISHGKYLVTGASSGIGRGISQALLSENHEVIGLARRKQKLFEIQNANTSFTPLHFDILEFSNIPAIVETLPVLDGIVFSHGPDGTFPAHMINISSLRNVLDPHLSSIILFVKELLSQRKLNKAASIVFISSISGVAGTRGMSLYCAAKSGLDGYMRSLAEELAQKKIRCNCIAPNVIRTEIFADENNSIDWIDQKYSTIPLGIGEVADVTALALFLLSQESSYITGQSIKMTGLSKWIT
jgi:NAD(P)-dependent dehydrogenase (short-subunit alcohol dehydrogenase family)